MTLKTHPFTRSRLEHIVERFPTPFHIYDERAIRANAWELIKRFSWNEGFTEFFAVKATPNPFLLKVLKQEGFGADCSSLPELLLAESAGITGEEREPVSARRRSVTSVVVKLNDGGIGRSHAGRCGISVCSVVGLSARLLWVTATADEV